MQILRSVVLVSVGVVGFVACTKPESSPAHPAPQASGATAALAESAAPQASVTEKKAPPKPSKEKTVIDKATAKAYADGLKKGRSETLARNYDTAIAAFDGALKALPGDARALSERGYAKLLAGKLEEARKDLREAESATKDAKLLGQIHFNHGLVAEKLGHSEEAKASFVRSNALAPTKAAASKAGTQRCAAQIRTAPGRVKVVKDWLAMFEALRAEAKGTAKAASNAEARTALASRIPKEAQSSIVSFSSEEDGGLWELHSFVKVPEGMVVDLETMSTYYDMPCGGDVKATVTESSGLRIVRLEHASGMRIPVCEADGGELTDCSDGAMPVSSACGTADPEIVVTAFDIAKKQVLASVAVTDDGKAPKITVEGRTLKVTGAGCTTSQEL
jgi:hypothetical protein